MKIRLGYGYMPWSWTGNNQENKWLDLRQAHRPSGPCRRLDGQVLLTI